MAQKIIQVASSTLSLVPNALQTLDWVVEWAECKSVGEWASRHVHAAIYVETARNEAILRLHRARAEKQAKGFYGTPYTQALWNGIHLMQADMATCLKRAIERGHLLYCWDGSTLPAAREQASGLAS